MTLTQAAKYLGISRMTLSRLIREGVLPTAENPLDRRQRLIPRQDVERLQTSGATRPRPRTLASVCDPELLSDQIEEYLQRHRP